MVTCDRWSQPEVRLYVCHLQDLSATHITNDHLITISWVTCGAHDLRVSSRHTQHKALRNNYRVCGVYSPEPCAEVYSSRSNLVY